MAALLVRERERERERERVREWSNQLRVPMGSLLLLLWVVLLECTDLLDY